jgi:hypothetical protein
VHRRDNKHYYDSGRKDYGLSTNLIQVIKILKNAITCGNGASGFLIKGEKGAGGAIRVRRAG